MENTLYEYETEPATRPSFLTWLCILTFIGSGWTIVTSVYTYTSAAKYANVLSQQTVANTDSTYVDSTGAVHKIHDRNLFAEKMKTSFSKILNKDNLKKDAIGKFIAALFTLMGALLMWKLKRTGFYIYIVGIIIGIIIPFYLYGNDLIAVGATSFANFFGLIFIALYALNLKSMRSNPA
ncbi:MAG: hypothetical protein ABI267_07605 [Ginsengibacter sp.]